jgi:putative ABC transport system permease protein
MIQTLRREVSLLDENLPVRITTMNELVSSSRWWQRLGVTLLSILGGLGLLLTAVGIYGVTAYIVAQRTREIGVRMALGAQASDIVKLIMRQGIKLTVIGAIIGLAVGLAGMRLLASFLYGVSTTDLMIFAAASIYLIGVALFACFLPALRATKIDPMALLRRE